MTKGPSTSPAPLRLRPPQTVMTLARLGAFHQCRLSFMRQLTRRMARERWTFSRPVFEIDARGVGRATYAAHTGARTYTLVCFAHDLPEDQRSDRVIAEAWDATFTLFDGEPTVADLDRLSQNVPAQEAGRISQSELTLSRANRSGRLWTHVVDALASGQQPDTSALAEVGYLMRTTAVYGSGKFGAADRESYADRPEMAAPFQAEMLTVWLARVFVRDLVNHMARAKGGARAVALDPAIAESLGIGNSTGLGMAPFLVRHPELLNNWITARETAIARVCAVDRARPKEVQTFTTLLDRLCAGLPAWTTSDPEQRARVDDFARDLDRAQGYCAGAGLSGDAPWARLLAWSEETLGLEAQEALTSLILEPYGALVDDLCKSMSAPSAHHDPIDGQQSVEDVRRALEQHYDWALRANWDDHSETARVWYVSEEKLEPRLGERAEEPVEPYAHPLDSGRAAWALYQTLEAFPPQVPIAEALLLHPQHRTAVRRVQLLARAPYAEIRDNTISARLRPIDMLRAKLSFFGATRFDPRSDRWLRITMFQNAPYPETLSRANADGWVYETTPVP